MLGVYNISNLSPDLNILDLVKFEVYCSVFQLLSKDLHTGLAHLRVLLCRVFTFFLTIVLVYLEKLLDFSLRAYGSCYISIDSDLVDFVECVKIFLILI